MKIVENFENKNDFININSRNNSNDNMLNGNDRMKNKENNNHILFFYNNEKIFFRNFNIRNQIPKGLVNLGVNASINSILQCFYHCKILTNYLINEKYIEDKINIKNNSISSEYINIIKELNDNNDKEYINPSKFKDILIRENPYFINTFDSHDSPKLKNKSLDSTNKSFFLLKIIKILAEINL